MRQRMAMSRNVRPSAQRPNLRRRKSVCKCRPPCHTPSWIRFQFRLYVGGGQVSKQIGEHLDLFNYPRLPLFTAAHAQTYTVLHTYPIGAGATSGIGAPALMSQGRDGNLYSTIFNDGNAESRYGVQDHQHWTVH